VHIKVLFKVTNAKPDIQAEHTPVMLLQDSELQLDIQFLHGLVPPTEYWPGKQA